MWIRKKFFYIAYNVHVGEHRVINGEATYTTKGLPDIELWIKSIKAYNAKEGIPSCSVQVISCIEVKKDFIK